jgi:hypothetical protein
LKKYDIHTIEKAAKVCPIYLHSFNYGTVKHWAMNTELPRNYLIEDSDVFDLEDVNKYATGIGFEDDFLWDYDTNKPTALLEQARRLGLIVHIWTFKDDALLFNAKNNIVILHLFSKCIVLLRKCLSLMESSQNFAIFTPLSRRCSFYNPKPKRRCLDKRKMIRINLEPLIANLFSLERTY